MSIVVPDIVVPDAVSTAETYEAYQALCAFCSWALYADPTEQTMRGMVKGRAMFREAPFTQVADAPARRLAGIFEEAAGGPEAFEALMGQVRRDRTYLFLMAGASKVSPYESVWRTDDATLFGPQTLEVRRVYERGGLVFSRHANEPDDHIGLEFSFAAHQLRAAAAGDEAALALLRDFLADHLLVFGPACLTRIAERAKSDYFRSVCGIALGTLESLAVELGATASATLPATGGQARA